MKTLFTIIVISFFTACQSETNRRLEQAFHLAEENCEELEKVLDHYKNDTLKLKAAQFLIANMPGHTGYDPSIIEILQPIYKKHVAISEKYNWERPSEWKKEINDCWDEDKNKIKLLQYPLLQDIKTLKADWLIKEIDLVFKAWQENAFTKNAPFEDFCRYILPYRFNDQFCLDNNREIFYNRHHGIFNDTLKDFRVITDSLHFIYKDIMHSGGNATSMPICNIASYEQIKRGICENQTQFNAHMMSALGMAVATDLVPGWGNRSEGHSWNALIIDGKTYPFEPFWEDNRWKYNQVYNNIYLDFNVGKLRLPKVYRQSFEYYMEGPMIDKDENRNNIPGLFKYPWIRDVSSEYFQPTDVTVELSESTPNDTHYCYLCVYNALNMGWTPVQWGKITNKKVIFKGMGRDIVYLPAFYQNGTVIPATSPFILDEDGNCHTLKHEQKKTEKIITNTTTPLTPRIESPIVGACFIGSNDLDDPEQQDTLCILDDKLDFGYNEIPLHYNKPYRYIRLVLSQNILALGEISFYEQQKEQPTQISSVKVTADVKQDSIKELEKLVDGFSGTGFMGSFNSERGRKKGIVFDLGKETKIHSIAFVPLAESKVNNNDNFTLYYWDDKWIEVNTVIGDQEFITFDQVPSGALYLIKCSKPTGSYYAERIFTYMNGITHWF